MIYGEFGLLGIWALAAIAGRCKVTMKYRHTKIGVVFITLFSMVCGDSSYCQLSTNKRLFDSLAVLQHSQASPRNLMFIKNNGQLFDQHGKPMPEVLYYAESRKLKFYFTKTGFHYVFSKTIFGSSSGLDANTPFSSHLRNPIPKSQNQNPDSIQFYRVDAEFTGSNPEPLIETSWRATSWTNYYLTQSPSGITCVPSFGTLVYKNLYPKIDLEVNSTDSGMRYDYIVHPGGDPNMIALHYAHADSLRIAADGRFRIRTPLGEVIENHPYSYQLEEAGLRKEVASDFFLSGDTLKFSVGAYNRSADLVIDPPRLWGTYFGGGDDDEASGIGIDRAGNIDICGYTHSTANIATTGAFQITIGGSLWDAFIASFAPDGSMRWATYYGGTGVDLATGIACDSILGVVISGYTTSTNAIATAGAYQTTPAGTDDAFIASFDSTGARRWGTYFGGSDYDDAMGIAIDSSQNIVLTGETYSSNGIATSGAFQTTRIGSNNAYIAKFTLGGSLLWATYFGEGSGVSIAADVNDNIYVGSMNPDSGIATSGAYQTAEGKFLLAKFSSSGSRDWATYYMSLNNTSGGISRVAAGNSGNLYFSGYTSSTGGARGVLGKIGSGGTLVWDVYLGNNTDNPNILSGIAIDSAENVFACGYTSSQSGIATPAEFQTTLIETRWYTPFMVKYGSDGMKLQRWGTYYEDIGGAKAICVDRIGRPAIVGWTATGGSEFATAGAYQTTTNSGNNDVFVAKFCDALFAISVSPAASVCPGTSVTLTATPDVINYQWRLGGVIIPGATSRTYTVPATLAIGNYDYSVDFTVTDPRFCDTIPNAMKKISVTIGRPLISFTGASAVCPGSSVKLKTFVQGRAPFTYSWTPSATLDSTNSAQPTATPTQRTTYHLTVKDSIGCVNEDSIVIKVNPNPQIYPNLKVGICPGSAVLIGDIAHNGTPPYSYQWVPSKGLSSGIVAKPYVFPTADTTYTEIVTDAAGCQTQATITIVKYPTPVVHINPAGPISFCKGDSVILYLDKIFAAYQWSTGSSADKLIVKQGGSYFVTVQDTNGCQGISKSVSVTVTSLHPDITPKDSLSICNGGNIILHADTGYRSYLWSNGSIGDSLIANSAGKYYVSVIDQYGCQGTSDTVLIASEKSTLVINGPHSACPQSTTGYRAFSLKNASLQWNLSGGGTIKKTSHPDSIAIQWIAAGIWVLTVSQTTSQGCTTDTNISIKVSPTLTPTITPNGNLPLCGKDSIVLYAEKGYFSYQWSDGSTTDSIIVRQAGSFSVHVVGYGGCSGNSDAVNVTLSQIPVVSIVADGSHLCKGNTLHLSTSGVFNHYLWSTGDTARAIEVSQTGTYSVLVTDSSGCTGMSEPVIIDSMHHLQIFGPQSICIGEGATGYNVPKETGVTYFWSVANGTITKGQGSDSVIVQWNNASIGTASLTLIDSVSGGCVDTTTIPITIDANIHPVIIPKGPISFCQGDSVSLDGGSGYATYQWFSDGAKIPGATMELLRIGQSGNYTVAVTSSGSCNGISQAVSVIVYPLPQQPVVTQIKDTLFCSFAASYQWFFNSLVIPGATNQRIVASKNGSYIVTISDGNVCSSSSAPFQLNPQATATVRVGQVPSVNPGNTFEVPIELVASQDLILTNANHYIGMLRYNGTMIRPTGSRGGTLGQNRASGEGTDRTVGFEGFSAPMTSGTLQWIQYKAALGNDSSTLLTIDTFYWTDADVAVLLQGGSFSESGLCFSGGRILLLDGTGKVGLNVPHPNPANSHIIIGYDLVESGRTKLALTDLVGRTAKIINDEDQKPGHYEVDVSLEDISSGFYLSTLKTPSQLLRQPFVVSK